MGSRFTLVCSLLLAIAPAVFGGDEEAAIEHFEKRVRPLLAEKCWDCHGPTEQEGALRLDTAAGVRKGGDRGKAIRPGDPDQSLLIQAVRRTGDLEMPPESKLSPAEVAALERWIANGAPWPDTPGAHPAESPSAAIEPREPNDESLASSLQLWLKADALQRGDNESVVVWPDSSGRGHDLTATEGVRAGGVGKAPKFVAVSGVNGYPAVRFDPRSGMAGSPDHVLDIHGDAAVTIILVVRLEANDASPPYDNVLMIGNPAAASDPGRPLAAYIEIDRSGGETLDFAGGWTHDASLGPGSAQVLYETPHVTTITKTPGPLSAHTTFHFDGRSSLEVLGQAPVGSEGIPDIMHRRDFGVSIGKAASWSGSVRGDYAEVIVYNRALSDWERRGVEAHLARKYGLLTPEMIELAARRFSDEEMSYWAFRPVVDPALPEVNDAGWPSTPVDRFVLAALEANGLRPAPVAGRHSLIRRASFDSTGLPPTPAEIESFAGDPEPTEVAVAKLIDRLLASPHYGERWGRHWLDVARYADTTANDGNFIMRYAYRYRDYVVDSLNQDKPYDHFLSEQLAGDLMPPSDDPKVNAQRIIATGFLMVGPKALAETDKEQVKMDIVDEQIDVMGRAMLGLTISCARCHDHKFDPIPTIDYYSLAGIFRSTEVFADLVRNASMWMEYPVPLGPGAQPIKVMAPRDGRARHLRVHLRGNRFRLGAVAPRRFLQILAGENHPPLNSSASGRLELARWIADAENPLTARVMVNRIWQGHFGVGLVPTSDNFGVQGEPPSHPELLDWLACRFIESGWSVKAMHRLIMLSSTYRQSALAGPEETSKAAAADPRNRLLWRAPRRRLDAEQLRDGMLAASGRLEARIGGDALLAKLYDQGQAIDKDRGVVSASQINNAWAGFDSPRRSLYLPVIRNGQPDVLALFDAADANAVTPIRNETTVPAQAAFLLNNPFALEQARGLAQRLLRSGDNIVEHLQLAFRLTFGRDPTAEESREAVEFIEYYRDAVGATNGAAGNSLEDAWTTYCQTLFCANEFIYVE